MRKKGTLKTRKSTLGATREERISSAMQSLVSKPEYAGEKINNNQNRSMNTSQQESVETTNEHRDETAPSSFFGRDREVNDTSQREPPSFVTTSIRDPPAPSSTSGSRRLRGFSPRRRRSFSPLRFGLASSSRSRGRSLSSPRSRARSTSSKRSRARSTSSKRSRARSASSPRSQTGPASSFASTMASRPRLSEILSKSTERNAEPETEEKSTLDTYIMPSYSSQSESDYEEEIELLNMRDHNNRKFVRILATRTNYKPNMGDGEEVILRSIRSKEHQNADSVSFGATSSPRSVQSKKESPTVTSIGTARSFKTNRTSKTEKTTKSAKSQITTKSMPPILKTIDTNDLSVSGNSLKVGSTGGHSQSNKMNPIRNISERRKSKQNSKSKRKSTIRNAKPNFLSNFSRKKASVLLDEDEDINASNYYGIHSLKREKIPLAKRLLTLNRKRVHIPIPNEDKSAKTTKSSKSIKSTKSAKKEQEKQTAEREKKEKKEQELLDKEAKKQIKKEMQKQEQELKKQEQESKKQEQESKKKKRQEVRQNTAVNSSNLSKITYVSRPYSDNEIYNESQSNDKVNATRYDVLPAKSSESKGVFGKLMFSFSSLGDKKDKKNGIPASVSFVSSTEEAGTNDDRYAVRKPRITTISGYNRAAKVQEENENLFFGVINDIGTVFGFGKTPPKDERDLRMVDSEISSSRDEGDSFVSSMGYYTYSLD